MKRLLISVSTLILSSLPALALEPPIQIGAPIAKMYAPIGFDDNDISEIVITGSFPNTCYQLGEANALVDHDERTIRVSVLGYKFERDICIQMVAPFMKTIKLGHLKAGDYTVITPGNLDVKAKLSVAESTANQRDDFIYLPVEYADVVKGPDGQQKLFVSGRMPKMKKSCMQVSRATIRHAAKDMVIVQPIAEITPEDSCEGGQQDTYHHYFDMPFSFKGEGLLHVRSLNGASYNKIIHISQ